MIYVAALIINWNGSDDTLHLIDSLAEQIEPTLQIEVVVVDNASDAQDLGRLRAGLDERRRRFQISLIENRSNVGVPAGYNQAIAAVRRRDCLFLRLDNDVVFLSGGVRALCETLLASRGGGVRIVGGNIKYFDSPSRDNGGAYFFDMLRGKNRVVYPTQDTKCDGVLGCVMLIDPEVVRAYEPEVFLAWLFFTTDESELSIRCRARKWTTLYTTRSVALHKGGRSTRKVASLANYLSVRNWSYLALRYVQPRIAVPLVLARIAVTVAYKLLRGKTEIARGIIAGTRAAVRDQRGLH